MGERTLIVIPAYNEEDSIAEVLMSLRRSAAEFDRVVVNDGSEDDTGRVVAGLGEKQLLLACNVGYGHALQIGLRYGLIAGYDIIVSFDADGQHRAEDVRCLVQELLVSGADMIIGSRYCDGQPYASPLDRRLGQLLFSHMTRLLTGRRIYDTTSGFKAIRAEACRSIIRRAFLDFHIEMIVGLSLSGFTINEYPIIVNERASGRSMYSFVNIMRYPLKTLLLTVVAVIDGYLERRTR